MNNRIHVSIVVGIIALGIFMLTFSTIKPICVKSYNMSGKLVYSNKLALIYSGILSVACSIAALFFTPVEKMPELENKFFV